jgi:hypothetical protein
MRSVPPSFANRPRQAYGQNRSMVRSVLSVLLLAVACALPAPSADAEIRIVWRAVAASWDYPATEAQDALADPASAHTDFEREIQRAALPGHGDGKPHVTDSPTNAGRTACAGAFSRAPPSA